MNSRNTIQGGLVYEAVQTLKNHPTADEVYDYLVKSNPAIGRATVYRNLNRLAKNGKVLKINVPGGADRFDYRLDSHYHFKCLKCGGLFDINKSDVKGLNPQIQDAHGFEFADCEIIFTGLCPACQKKAS